MNVYYNYSRYEDDEIAPESVFDNVGRDSRENPWGAFTFPEWFMAKDKAARSLLWMGILAIGVGILLIVFPMLLVVAVSSLFFALGVVCLAVWWQVRRPGHRIRIDSRPDWLTRVRNWFRQRIG